MTKIYRMKLSEIRKLIKEDWKVGDPLEGRPEAWQDIKPEDEEMDRRMEMEEDPAEKVANDTIEKIQQIMTDLAIQLHDMAETNEEGLNAIVEILDKKLGEKVVSMMW